MSAAEPTVTVIIPTCDRPESVAAAVDSALAQTHAPHEVIVVDDGSDPPAVVGPRARLIRVERSAGPGPARNLAAVEAQGELLAFLDDDDRWRPEKLGRQIAALAESGAAAAYSGWAHCDGATVFDTVRPVPDGELRGRILRGPAVVPSTLLIRAATFHELGGFDPSLRFGEDWEFSLRLVQRHELVAVDEVLVDRQIHPYRRFGSRLVTDHVEMMRHVTPSLRSLPVAERVEVRGDHLRRLAQYGLRLALEPLVVGRRPWRARHAVRRRRGVRRA